MKKLITHLTIWLMINSGLISPCLGQEVKYPDWVIKKYHIQNISEWYIQGVPKSRLVPDDSILKNYSEFDTNGRCTLAIERNYGNEVSKRKRFVYYPSGRLQFESEVDSEDHLTWSTYEYIYSEDKLIEKRDYSLIEKRIPFSEYRNLKKYTYSIDYYNYDPRGRLVERGYARVNENPAIDSTVSRPNPNGDGIIISVVPKKQIVRDSIKYTFRQLYQYTDNGDLLSRKTPKGSTDLYEEYFWYDSNHNSIKEMVIRKPSPYTWPRRKDSDIDTTTFWFKNYYEKGVLTERRKYFEEFAECYLATFYKYYTSGQISEEASFTCYPCGSLAGRKIEYNQIIGLYCNKNQLDRATHTQPNICKDSARILRFTQGGSLYDKLEFDLGTPFYRHLIECGMDSIATLEFTSYGSLVDFHANKTLPPSSYLNTYTNYDNGLIKEVFLNHKRSTSVQYVFFKP